MQGRYKGTSNSGGKTVIKFRQLKNLKEFDSREKITMTGLLEGLMKNEFKKFDSKLIDWVYKKVNS